MELDMHKHWDYTRDDYSNRPEILFQDEFMDFIKAHKQILDIGSGTGQLVQKLNTTSERTAYGITYNPLEVKNKIHDNILLADMHNLPFRNESFDLFIMWDSLEHAQSAYIALCEAKRVLKINGHGLIFMPGQNWLDCSCHICVYTVAQMKQLFKQSGLKLIDVYEKTYPNDETISCEGMAIYKVKNDKDYKPTFLYK